MRNKRNNDKTDYNFDIQPDVWRIKDFRSRYLTPAGTINAAIQACRRDDGSCGGVIEFQNEIYHIDEPLILDVHNVTFRGPATQYVFSAPLGYCVLQAEYNGPIFEVPHEAPCDIGGLKFEGLQFDGNVGGENRSGILINTGPVYRAWFTIRDCGFKRFNQAICVNNSSNKDWGSIGNFNIYNCSITWNDQGIISTNGGRCHLFSIRDSAVRQNNRKNIHDYANYLPGECHTWDNVNLEMSGNAILYNMNSSVLKFENLWMEDMRGDYVIKLYGCKDFFIGYDFRYNCPMESPVYIQHCGRGTVLCNATIVNSGPIYQLATVVGS